MRRIILSEGFGLEHLKMESVPKPSIGSDEILVRIRAAALNYVDLAIIEGSLSRDIALPMIPVSDGAGYVEEVGSSVRGYKVGDLVATVYIPEWRAGPYKQEYTALETRPGTGRIDGQLVEYKAFKAGELIVLPPYLSPEEAATLPIAGVTAWNALAYGNIKPGDFVLIKGTGGVSIFALQFAKLFGATVIITSSSDAKLERAKALGADFGINYKNTPAVAAEVLRITRQKGVRLAVETVGGTDLSESIDSLRAEGTISVVGFLGGKTSEIDLIKLNMKRVTITGVSVGSVQDFQDMLAALCSHQIRPVISDSLPFEEFLQALKKMKDGSHFGKIVIRI